MAPHRGEQSVCGMGHVTVVATRSRGFDWIMRVQHCPLDSDGECCRAVQESDANPDVVIIDGRDRVNCLQQTVPCCAESTVFVFDDTHRDRYQKGLEWAKEQGYRLLRFEGLKPGGLELNQSTLIYKPNNVFGI